MPLVIKKIDLAPDVGASLEVLERGTLRLRGERSCVFTHLCAGAGVETISEFVIRARLLH